jgi:hypothetical protein
LWRGPEAPRTDPALAAHGRHKKVLGAVLIAVGSAVSVAGVALTIDGALRNLSRLTPSQGEQPMLNLSAESIVGNLSVLGGDALVAGGIVSYILGGRDVRRAGLAGLSVAPLADARAVSGAAAQLTFAF